jgi:hypothetical protein
LSSDKDNEYSAETMRNMIETAATRHETYQLQLALKEYGPAARKAGLTDKEILRNHLAACRHAIENLASIIEDMEEKEVREKVLIG